MAEVLRESQEVSSKKADEGLTALIERAEDLGHRLYAILFSIDYQLLQSETRLKQIKSRYDYLHKKRISGIFDDAYTLQYKVEVESYKAYVEELKVIKEQATRGTTLLLSRIEEKRRKLFIDHFLYHKNIYEIGKELGWENKETFTNYIYLCKLLIGCYANRQNGLESDFKAIRDAEIDWARENIKDKEITLKNELNAYFEKHRKFYELKHKIKSQDGRYLKRNGE